MSSPLTDLLLTLTLSSLLILGGAGAILLLPWSAAELKATDKAFRRLRRRAGRAARPQPVAAPAWVPQAMHAAARQG